MGPPHHEEHFEEQPLGELGDTEEPEPWLPFTDWHTGQLVEDAVDELAWARSGGPWGPGLRLLCLVSLMAEAEAHTYDYVARAYEACHSWDAISWATGDLLGDLEGTYGPYVKWRAKDNPEGQHQSAPPMTGIS
jgi:hypothetical protein